MNLKDLHNWIGTDSSIYSGKIGRAVVPEGGQYGEYALLVEMLPNHHGQIDKAYVLGFIEHDGIVLVALEQDFGPNFVEAFATYPAAVLQLKQ